MKKNACLFLILMLSLFSVKIGAQEKSQWVEYAGGDGPGKGKNIVLISGDEEYRSEEALPMLAQILAKKYGFNCKVLFSINPKTKAIDVRYLSNIPGLQSLQKADLMIIFTRFRELPDSQMKFINEYVMAGKSVIGLRTATHAFYYKNNLASIFAKYDWHSKTKGWEKGFGKQVLGETWIDHHGSHGHEGTRGLINGIEQDAKNPILNGVTDIWTTTDVYSVTELTDSKVLVYGQCTTALTPDSPVNLKKSIMPVAWTRLYKLPGGKQGKAFTTTMGAAIDFDSEDLRRLLVNASFWAIGLEKQIPEKADVNVVSEYKPTMFGTELFKDGVSPSQYDLK